ncbi:MAG: tetratricopeptide repeat protein, partial [Cyanobacteria bacterium J06650_10]
MHDMTSLPNALASQAQSPLGNYLKHLNAFENKESPSVEETIAVMLARDAVEQWMSPQVGAEAVSKVVHLDERLRSQAIKMHHLPTCRDTTNPPTNKWWWWLSTITIENAEMVADNAEDKAEADAAGVPGWARWDWLWNLGTVSCLVISAGLMSQTAKAFSKEGFDLFGTISTIGQGAGLAIVASGAITEDGKKKVQNILKGFNIPEQYHSEVTFAGSTVMLAASAGLLFNLPTVGNVYYNLGQRQERQGIWDKALESYQRAARFSPQNSDIVLAEGRLHETLGNFPAAIAAYEPEANLGKPEFNNALARTLLTQGFQTKNWELPLRKRTLSAI